MYLNDTCPTRRRLIKWSTNSWTIQNYSLFVFGKTSNSETFTFCPILSLKKCVPVSIWPSTISVQDTRAFYTLKGEWWLKGFHGSWSQESGLFTPLEKCIRHCVCTRKKDTLCLRSSTSDSYWISPLRSASKKAFAGSYCILPWKFQMACNLHLQSDISRMFSKWEWRMNWNFWILYWKPVWFRER